MGNDLKAPERIWHFAKDLAKLEGKIVMMGDTEYVRADLPPTLAQALEVPEVRALVEALRKVERCLIFPVATGIDPRGYNTRTPTEESIEFMVDEIRAALAALDRPEAELVPVEDFKTCYTAGQAQPLDLDARFPAVETEFT